MWWLECYFRETDKSAMPWGRGVSILELFVLDKQLGQRYQACVEEKKKAFNSDPCLGTSVD